MSAIARWPAFPSSLVCKCGQSHVVAIHDQGMEVRDKFHALLCSAALLGWYELDGWLCPRCWTSACADAHMRERAGQRLPWRRIEDAIKTRAGRLQVEQVQR